MTSFKSSSKCALSLVLAVMMLFTSMLTGAEAITKPAGETVAAADTAVEQAVDTTAAEAAETAKNDAAQPEEQTAEEKSEAPAQLAEAAKPAEAKVPEASASVSDVSVKKTPEKSGSRTVTIYFDNSFSTYLTYPAVFAWNSSGNPITAAWNDTDRGQQMTSVSGNIFSCTITNAPDGDFYFIISGWDAGANSIQKSVDITYKASYSSDKIWRVSPQKWYQYIDGYDNNNPIYKYKFNSDVADYSASGYSSSTAEYTLSNFYIYRGSSDNPASFDTYEPIRYCNSTGYHADINTESIGTSNVYFALLYGNTSSNYTSILDRNNSKTVTNNSTDYLNASAKDYNVNNESNKTYFGYFGAKTSDVTNVKIEVNLDPSVPSFSTYTLSATAIPYKLFAKDGTIRLDSNYHHQKYADFCDTVINTVNGGAPTKKQENEYETASVKAGDVVNITTTISYPYNAAYYVKGFCVNGVTYGSIEEPAPGDTRRTSDQGGEYTLTYTVPDTFTYIEITPIYFYIENGGTYSDLGFITFHVEKYTGNIEAQWGNTISCQTWYTDGVENGNGLTPVELNYKQNALGGFPGQPLVFENGDYYMQVPKKLPINGSAASVTVQGMTLSNFFWDDVHRDLANRADGQEFRGSENNRAGEDNKERNSQTYDFNDFAALAKMGAEDIIFTFKYRTAIYNRDTITNASQLNSVSNILSVAWQAGVWNGWDGLVDYHDRAVDLAGNIITKPGTNEPYTEDDLVKAANGTDKVYTAQEAQDLIWVVSRGYQDIKGHDENEYYGNFATAWDFYKYTVGTGFEKINTTSLPGSSFIPPEDAYELVNGELPGSGDTTPSAKVSGQTMYQANKARYLAFSDTSGTYRNTTYNEFINVYNATLNKRTMIAYEQSKLYSGDYLTTYGGDNKNYGNPALRCDGRWYYSNADTENVTANLMIEYKNAGDTSYTFEPSYDNTGKGQNTGATVRFTSPDNDDATKVWKNTDGVHATESYSEKEYFAFNADSYATNTVEGTTHVYKFAGWYMYIDGHYTPINPADITNVNGKHVRNVTNDFIARYEEITGGYAIIDHQVLSTSAGGGSAYTTVQVYENGTLVKTYAKTEGPVQIAPEYLTEDDHTYTFTVTLTAEPDAYSSYTDGTYSDQSKTPMSDWTHTNGTQVWTKTLISESEIKALVDPDTKTKVFYSEFDFNTLAVTYKYYDRALTENATVDISNTTSTAILAQVPYREGETIEQIIMNGLNQKVSTGGNVTSIANILDQYYIWPTQAKAVAGIANLPDYKQYVPNGTTPNYSKRNQDNDFTKHFDSVGEPVADTTGDYQWVNYYSESDLTGRLSPEDEDDETGYRPYTDVQSVVVWAFNTPKLYDLNFYYPNDDIAESTTVTENNTEVTVNDDWFAAKLHDNIIPDHGSLFCISRDEGINDVTMSHEKTFYGQRLGVKIGEDDSDARNVAGTHAHQYGISVGYTGQLIKAKQTIVQTEDGATVATYYFDGWYDLKTGAKISTDYDYGYRVTTGMDLVAGYVRDTVASEEDDYRKSDVVGVSVTANDYDFYFTTGTNSVAENIRYNTQLNVYNTVDNDVNIKDSAIVYVRMRVQGVGGPYTTDHAKELLKDSTFVSQLRTEIQANLNAANPAASTRTTYNNATVAVEYYYVYGNGDNSETTPKLTLNNKNRGMFTTSFTMSEVATNAPYSAMLAFGAINYGTDGWRLSDNMVEYVDVTVTE